MLFFVEDAGAANYISPVLKELLGSELGSALHILATGKGAEVLKARGISFASTNSSKTIPAMFYEFPWQLVVTGTAEDPHTLGLKLIDKARERGITSIGVVDGPANADYRFAGPQKTVPLKHAPDWLMVADQTTKKLYVDRGFFPDRIAICGHPAYERALAFSEHPPGTRATLRSQHFPNAQNNQPIILFVSETSHGLSSGAFERQSDYTLFGSGTSDRRTDIVLEEVLKALDALSLKPYFVLRLHPNNTATEFARYRSQIDQISQGDDPLSLVYAADLVVGLTSILLDEAAVMGRPSLAVLPRHSERQWLAGIETGWVRCATDCQELKTELNTMLSPKYAIPSINRKMVRDASGKAARFIYKRLGTDHSFSPLG